MGVLIHLFPIQRKHECVVGDNFVTDVRCFSQQSTLRNQDAEFPCGDPGYNYTGHTHQKTPSFLSALSAFLDDFSISRGCGCSRMEGGMIICDCMRRAVFSVALSLHS